MQTIPDEAKVVIIGGGVAGVAAALELAKRRIEVTLIEKNKILSGSSGRNPGRMGHGFHYFDLETAITYLEASIAVQREYPDFLVGQDLVYAHPIRHGRYYITNTSMHSYEDIIQVYFKLQDHYRRLVAKDPKNMVFGHPDSFFKVLSPSEYADDINEDIIVGGIETNEHLFNWTKFAKFIHNKLQSTPFIHIFENTEVVDIAQRERIDMRFTLTLKQDAREDAKLSTNFIINSSWENIEFLNDKIGIRYIPGTRSNRLKCLLEVNLPPDLLMTHSSFFCMGSFCMFSNMGDGRGMLTLADVTNMASSSDLKISDDIEQFLRGDIPLKLQEEIAKNILVGVSLYIPKMSQATIIGLKFGIVQTQGHLNLKDLKTSITSAHHKRNYDGIREEQQGLLTNPAMKLFYFPINARKIRQLFFSHHVKEVVLTKMLNNLFHVLENDIFNTELKLDLKKSLMIHIDKLSMLYPSSRSEEIYGELNPLINVIQYRSNFLHELRQMCPDTPSRPGSPEHGCYLTRSFSLGKLGLFNNDDSISTEDQLPFKPLIDCKS